jgi:hypothetical protein
MQVDRRALGVGLFALLVFGACSQGAPPQGGNPSLATTVPELATSVATLEPRFNATAAVGGGFNSSLAVSADDVSAVLAQVPQASQLKLTASSSPPGARGQDVVSVSIVAQDAGTVLQGLDQAGKRTLADGLLTAAGTTWPKASVTLFMSDPSGGGQIIGSRAPGGPNTVIVSP